MRARSLTRHLLAWTLGTLMLLWATFIFFGYRAGQLEAAELTDGHLSTVAALLISLNSGDQSGARAVLTAPPPGQQQLKSHEYQQTLSAVMWNQQGEVISRIGQPLDLAFDSPDGFSVMSLGPAQRAWRTFTRWDEAHAIRVMVLISEDERNALADDIAGQISEPGWLLLPFMLLALGLAIHRGLKPLRELSSEVHALEVQHPRPLAVKSRHEELRAAVDAINRLVGKYDQALVAERQLADTIAHELRTPLTALGLRLDALREQVNGPAQHSALEQVEAEAQRANQVLSHLLALARTSRIKLHEDAVSLDLAALAWRVIAEHVPPADAAGHELGYFHLDDQRQEVDVDRAVMVQGHPVLIDIALRNLLENALAHAPAHSQIDVQLSTSPVCLQVCDGPSAAKMNTVSQADLLAGQPNALTRKGLGFGLGHQVITRIAEVHGGTFEELAAPQGYKRCYRLTFP